MRERVGPSMMNLPDAEMQALFAGGLVLNLPLFLHSIVAVVPCKFSREMMRAGKQTLLCSHAGHAVASCWSLLEWLEAPEDEALASVQHSTTAPRHALQQLSLLNCVTPSLFDQGFRPMPLCHAAICCRHAARKQIDIDESTAVLLLSGLGFEPSPCRICFMCDPQWDSRKAI